MHSYMLKLLLCIGHLLKPRDNPADFFVDTIIQNEMLQDDPYQGGVSIHIHHKFTPLKYAVPQMQKSLEFHHFLIDSRKAKNGEHWRPTLIISTRDHHIMTSLILI